MQSLLVNQKNPFGVPWGSAWGSLVPFFPGQLENFKVCVNSVCFLATVFFGKIGGKVTKTKIRRVFSLCLNLMSSENSASRVSVELSVWEVGIISTNFTCPVLRWVRPSTSAIVPLSTSLGFPSIQARSSKLIFAVFHGVGAVLCILRVMREMTCKINKHLPGDSL